MWGGGGTAGGGKWRSKRKGREGGGGEVGNVETELWEIKRRRDPLSSWNVLVGLSWGRLLVKGHLWVMKACVCGFTAVRWRFRVTERCTCSSWFRTRLSSQTFSPGLVKAPNMDKSRFSPSSNNTYMCAEAIRLWALVEWREGWGWGFWRRERREASTVALRTYSKWRKHPICFKNI